jgi:hypothetical protein
MQNLEFFSEIPQAKVQWGNSQVDVPVFYRDTSNIVLFILAPLSIVRRILPSGRMHPYRVTPWHSIVSIAAYEYKDSDIGPYNEVSIGIPFILDRVSPIFTGLLWKPPEVPMVYVCHLPVTTEVARLAGIEFANFPKFLAEITFHSENEWLICEVRADGRSILTLTGRKIRLSPSPRQRSYPITMSKGSLLRLELVRSECEMGTSRLGSDAKLELGNHQIAEELRDWHLGKVMAYQYCPACQAILAPVCESYAI